MSVSIRKSININGTGTSVDALEMSVRAQVMKDRCRLVAKSAEVEGHNWDFWKTPLAKQLSDLRRGRVLGAGGFAYVQLVTASDTQYALKAVSKQKVIAADMVRGLFREKD